MDGIDKILEGRGVWTLERFRLWLQGGSPVRTAPLGSKAVMRRGLSEAGQSSLAPWLQAH